MRAFRLILFMALGAMLYRGGLAAYQSAPFELKEFEVEGNSGRRISDEQIVAAAGVLTGAKLLEVSTESMVSRISEIPWIAKARVERLLPSKLRISVVERRPELVVATGQGPYLVDPEGLVLQKGTEDLVQVSDLPLGELRAGERLTSREFLNAAAIYKSLPRQIRASVSVISAPTIDQTTIRTAGGPSIFYGAAEQIDDKNFALESLYTSSKGINRGSIIDVRVPSRPTMRSG
jgi:cell division protein FtsQ